MITTRSRRRLLALLLSSFIGLPTFAATAPAVASEVSSLLGRLAASRCEFYRNGSWYGAAAAQKHLQKKYQYLADHSMIASTEDFIRQGATTSSSSGEAYRVRCEGRVEASADWLTRELQAIRAR